MARDVPAVAVILYDTPSGPAYAQLSGVLISNKSEMRVCDGIPRFDKRSYDDMLQRVQLAVGAVLERGPDGALLLTMPNAKPVCVVPSNLRFDRPNLSTSEAADQLLIQGNLLSASVPQSLALPVPMKPGMKLFIVAAPDTELAEFLLAQRIGSIRGWQDFLVRYGSAAHAADARQALASLYLDYARASFEAYRNSSPRDYARLKQAESGAEQADATLPGSPDARSIMAQVQAEIDKLLASARSDLQLYRKALADHAPGWAHFTAAHQAVEQAVDVNARYSAALALQTEINGEGGKVDSVLQIAESLAAARRFDEALRAIAPYRSFTGELPRLSAIVDSAYNFHFTQAQNSAHDESWVQAAAEYRKALEIKPNSNDAATGATNADVQMARLRDQQAADQALAQSKAFMAKRQVVDAYNVLVDLSPSQQALVSAQIAALKTDYVPAAVQLAQKLQDLHLPIRGRADEDGVRQAWQLFDRAAALSTTPAYKLKRDILGEKIATYYFTLAKQYLEKPLGTGAGVGWLYLQQALHYGPYIDGLKDAITRYEPAWQLRSRLSLAVVFRDQTSRSEGAGFADQLTDALANSLESSGMAKVLRQRSDSTPDPDSPQPNFSLIGEILQHRIVKKTSVDTLPSKYRVGVREVKNEAWLKLNDDLTAAQQQLTDAQRALADAQAKHRKPDITAADQSVQAAQKKVDDLRKQLDSTDQTRPEPVIDTYNYTKTTLDLDPVIEMSFRIADQTGNPIEPPVPFKQDNHKIYVVLDNVKPEDTEGVKIQNAAPDETQLLADLEIVSRDALIKAVREKISHLPDRALQTARLKAQQNDADGAAEAYILFWNSTAGTQSPERDEAAAYLRDHFNVTLAQQ